MSEVGPTYFNGRNRSTIGDMQSDHDSRKLSLEDAIVPYLPVRPWGESGREIFALGDSIAHTTKRVTLMLSSFDDTIYFLVK